jgi:hypothetical protein
MFISWNFNNCLAFNPNGNFFNNWLMIVYSLPVGFYLQSIYSKKIIKKDL